jgi:sugar transferase (PEP-CTERM/EpsH1 system associated)
MAGSFVNRPISVLHIVLSTATGGMENVIYNLAAARDSSRLKLRVACLEAIGPLSGKLKQHEIESELIPKMTPGLSMIFPWSLIRFIRRSKCDIVHTHSGCWSKVATACAWIPRVKLVYTDHGRAFPELRDRIFLDRIAVRFTDRVVAVGEPLRDYLLNTVRLPENKVITIRNGIDTERFQPRPDRITVRTELGYDSTSVVIAIVARLAPVKNHRLLIETFSDLSKAYPSARLLIIGDGPLRGELETMTRDLSLSDKVRFTGDRPDVERLLGAADIATLSSQSEGVSLTLLEAMATGLPVVATNVGGNPAIISEGINGYLVGQDRSTYAAALGRLVESEDLRRTLGAHARQTVVDRWSVRLMAARYQELYAELVA